MPKLFPGSLVAGESCLCDSSPATTQRLTNDHSQVISLVVIVDVPFSFEADGSNKVALMTSGKVACCVSWAVGENGVPLVPPLSQQNVQRALSNMDAVSSIGASGLTDMKKLAKWAAESKLDPNDPNNAALMQLIMLLTVPPPEISHCSVQAAAVTQAGLQTRGTLTFQSSSDWSSCRRSLTLCQMTTSKVQTVPSSPASKPGGLRIPQLQDGAHKGERNPRQDISGKKIQLHIYIEGENTRLNMRRNYRTRMLALQKRIWILIGLWLPNISTRILGMDLFKLAEPKRPLKPRRKERKKVTAQNLSDGDIKVLVNVVRAYDIPVRKPTS
ncbi:unnamed protein product, partial [Ranitomeya imitator]